MFAEALANLGQGFGIALEPHNLMWCFVGVVVGNLVGVLPGMGVLSTVSILLPLTFGMSSVAAVLMIAGIFYGAQYGGAICAILLNLPCHPPHAVTCLEGYPMTKQGRGGVALGISIMGALFGAAFGITEMTYPLIEADPNGPSIMAAQNVERPLTSCDAQPLIWAKDACLEQRTFDMA